MAWSLPRAPACPISRYSREGKLLTAASMAFWPTPTCCTVKVLPAPTVASKQARIFWATAFASVRVMASVVRIWVVIRTPKMEMVTPSAATPLVSVYSEILRQPLPLSSARECWALAPSEVT